MLVEICLPMKNEDEIVRENLLKILRFCKLANFPFNWKIIGISNGSSDKTVEILRDLKKLYPEYVDYIDSPLPGRGRALKSYWATSAADIWAYLDIDLAVLPEQLPDLIMPLVTGGADIAIGSRLISGAKIERSEFREFISRVFNLMSRLVLAHKVSDLQCGFKAIKAETYRKILPYLRNDFWYFDSELIIIGLHFSYRLKEVPVNWVENRFKQRASKVKIVKDILKFLRDMVNLRWRLFFMPKK
ncbi:MAG: glycosyltransferase [Patescibacteria group bacterium]